MRHLRMLGIVVMAAALMAGIGAGTASATELFRDTGSTNDTISRGTTIDLTLKSKTSTLMRDTFGSLTLDTCTGSEIAAKLEEAGGETAHPGGKVSTLTFSGCGDTIDVLAAGKLKVEHKPETTNGYVYSSGAEVTFHSKVLGENVVCKTYEGTLIGLVTGAASGGHASLDINAVLNCGVYWIRWTGTYMVTNQTGLIVEAGPESEPEPPLGTELYRKTAFTNDTLGKGTTIKASLEPESSFQFKTTEGSLHDTCTGSEIAAEIEKAGGEGSHPSGKVSTLTFSGCSDTTDVLATGELKIERIPGTTDGVVTSSGVELKIWSTIYESNLVCKTSSGAQVGTLTGAAGEIPATLDINAVIYCGPFLLSEVMTGTYTVTNPTGLIVEPA